MTPEMEGAILKETEQAMRELIQAAENVGLHDVQVAMMLRRIANEIDPTPQ